MKKEVLDRREMLQRKLKKLTKSPSWLSDPIARAAVHEIRSELFPNSFTAKDDLQLDLLDPFDEVDLNQTWERNSTGMKANAKKK